MLECIISPFYVSIKHNHNSCPGGEIGRHTGLKILRLHGRAGSIPAPGTKSNDQTPLSPIATRDLSIQTVITTVITIDSRGVQ